MPETPKKQPELVQLDPRHIAIVGRNGQRVEVTGAAAARITIWHGHMMTHGPEWAATYLAGVVDGLAAAPTMRLEASLEATRAGLAEGAKLLDLVKARQAARDETRE